MGKVWQVFRSVFVRQTSAIEKSLLENWVMMRKPFEVSPKFDFLIFIFFLNVAYEG